MKFGVYFAYWEQEWKADYNYYCDKVARLGFDILEVEAGALAGMSDSELQELKNSAKRNNIELTSCIGLPPRYDVSSADDSVRNAGLDYLEKITIALEKVGIEKLGGIIYAYWPCDYSKPVDKAGAWQRSVESVRKAASFAKQRNVVLMLEVVNRFEQYILNSAQEAVEFTNEVACDNVKIMLDSFHMNIEEDNMGDAIRQAGKLLGHFHIGECNRKVPGKGRMPWDEMGAALRDINYDGAVVMEPFTRMGGTVGANIKVWRDLSGNADEAKLDEDVAAALKFTREKFL